MAEIFNNGKKVTPAQVKAYIKQVNGWTEEQYNRERYTIKNKLRTLEEYQRRGGKDVTAQSPVEVLYKEAKSKDRYGAGYKPTTEMELLRSFSGAGNKKQIDKLLSSKKAVDKLNRKYAATTTSSFQALINMDKTAAEIAENVTDPVKREKALSEYAKQLHTKQNAARKVSKLGGIPFGEAAGYSIGFDYSAYIDEADEEADEE